MLLLGFDFRILTGDSDVHCQMCGGTLLFAAQLSELLSFLRSSVLRIFSLFVLAKGQRLKAKGWFDVNLLLNTNY